MYFILILDYGNDATFEEFSRSAVLCFQASVCVCVCETEGQPLPEHQGVALKSLLPCQASPPPRGSEGCSTPKVYLLPLGESKLSPAPQPSLLGGSLVPRKGASLLFLPCSSPGQPAASPPLPSLPCPLPLPSQGGMQEALAIRVGRGILSTAGRSRLAAPRVPLQGGKQRILK